MIYRIDIQHFLIHAIDHFTYSDLTNFQYAIISSRIQNTGKVLNVVKMTDLYPDPETVIEYANSGDKDILEKMYMGTIAPDKTKKRTSNSITHSDSVIYNVFINPLLHHFNIMIICDESENDYIDILCKYLKQEFKIEVINLNTLFTKGRVGPIYIDRDDIWDIAVDLRIASARDQQKALGSSRDGRIKLISMMTLKEKITKLRDEYDIKVSKRDKDDIDSILLEAWCAEEPVD